MRSIRNVFLVCALGLLGAGAGVAEMASRSGLGETEFPTSGSPEAHERFYEGLLALHSFEYQDARDAFRAARKLEPDFAMAAWGEAMTHNHPLWLEEDKPAARAALERLAPTAEERRAKAPTAREKGYLNAVELLFGEGEALERSLAYAAAMGRLAEQYPEDLDAASFYALALLGTCHEGRDIPTYMRAAAVVEEVFAKNPRHPGAAHYLIHSYDDPVHAPLGLRAARTYAAIAPAAEHALHMPSHVFLALGMWERTAASNVDSYEAGEARRKRRDQGVGQRGYHALLWLHYARLQLGEVEEARRLLAIIAADSRETTALRTRRHLALMRAHHAVETGDWEHLPPAPDLADLSPGQVAVTLFTDGLEALGRDDLAGARKALAELAGDYSSRVEGEESCHANTSTYSRFGTVDLGPMRIMELQLDALIHWKAGEGEKADDLLAEATALEEERSFGFGPPMPPKPSHELYGELLLALDRPEEALEEFEKALERSPRRTKSLTGLREAARLSGDEATARRAAVELSAPAE